MNEKATITINVDVWRHALLCVQRDTMDAEPVAALRRIDALLDEIAWCNDGAHMATKARSLGR